MLTQPIQYSRCVIKYERNMLILQQWWSWKYLHYAVVIDDNWRELWRWEVKKLSYDVTVYNDDEIKGLGRWEVMRRKLYNDVSVYNDDEI